MRSPDVVGAFVAFADVGGPVGLVWLGVELGVGLGLDGLGVIDGVADEDATDDA